MQTYLIHWQFPDQEASMKGADVFLNMSTIAANPEGANGWAIVKASDHKAVWKWYQPWYEGFGNDIEVFPVLTDGEYPAVHKELG